MSEQEQGAEHLDTASAALILARLYRAQGKYEQAEPLYQRSLAICEQQLGPLHPHTQIFRRNYVALLRTMGRDAEAGALETKCTCRSSVIDQLLAKGFFIDPALRKQYQSDEKQLSVCLRRQSIGQTRGRHCQYLGLATSLGR